MKFQLKESLRGSYDESVLDDLRRVAKLLEKDTVTRTEYNPDNSASVQLWLDLRSLWDDLRR